MRISFTFLHQISALRSLTKEDGAQLVDNFRPVQALNNRVVKKMINLSWFH